MYSGRIGKVCISWFSVVPHGTYRPVEFDPSSVTSHYWGVGGGSKSTPIGSLVVLLLVELAHDEELLDSILASS